MCASMIYYNQLKATPAKYTTVKFTININIYLLCQPANLLEEFKIQITNTALGTWFFL